MGVAELGRVVAGSGTTSWSAAEQDSAAEVAMPDLATLQTRWISGFLERFPRINNNNGSIAPLLRDGLGVQFRPPFEK